MTPLHRSIGVVSTVSLEGGHDARRLRHGAAAGHGGQGRHLLHRGADQPKVSVLLRSILRRTGLGCFPFVVPLAYLAVWADFWLAHNFRTLTGV